MKAHLMYRDEDFDLNASLAPNEADLVHDLDLDTVLGAMANGDEFLLRVSRTALLTGLNNPAAILYRQQVLADCLANRDVVRQIYALVVKAVADVRRHFWFASNNSPSHLMYQSPQIIEMFLGFLKQLYTIVDEHSGNFTSPGWVTLFSILQSELDAEYFAVVEEQLQQLRFKDGTLISAQLGPANNGVNYVLRDPRQTRQTWKERLGVGGRKSFSFEIAPRDEAGAQALADIVNRGENLAANALTQAADHIADFFTMLRTELALYVGCLNLHERLARKGEPTCFAQARDWSPAVLSFTGLYDVCLSLRNEQRVTGNDANADGRSLIIVTGANSGGKSTFLRSLGIANLMMRSGMFVAAESFSASVGEALFTHFGREEDTTMTSGKLDEELARMDTIVRSLKTRSVVLFNESFSATNEREGSEIARQVVRAFLDADIRVVFVTHLYDFAESFFLSDPATTLFLQAGRQTDSVRNYKLISGEPLSTSYGEDVYNRIGGWFE